MRTSLFILFFAIAAASGQLVVQGPPAIPLSSSSALTAVTAYTIGSDAPQTGSQGGLGFSFIPSANITVTSLGRYIISGNALTHTMYLYSVSGTTMTLIGTTTINTVGGSVGTFKYSSITPTALSSGTKYAIMSAEESGDGWASDIGTGKSISFSSDLGTIVSSYSAGGVLGNTTANKSYVPVDFIYTKP